MVWWPRPQMWNWSAWCFNCLISQKCRNCELEDTRWQGKHRYGYGSNAICIWSCWSKEMRYGFWIQFSVSHGCLKAQFTVHCQTVLNIFQYVFITFTCKHCSGNWAQHFLHLERQPCLWTRQSFTDAEKRLKDGWTCMVFWRRKTSCFGLVCARGFIESASWQFFKAAIAQLVARGSHNPKVVSSILTGRICGKITNWLEIWFGCQRHLGKHAHAGSRTRVTSMGGLYETVTLHARRSLK